MTSKLTREWLQHQISGIEAVGITDSNTLAAFKLALTAMDSEPAMYCMEGNGLDPESVSTCREVVDAWVDEWNSDNRSPGEPIYKTVPLYRHAQPAPVVLDERAAFSAWNNDVDCPLAGRDAKSAAWMAWNYRAMLQAGNSPVIPDGYVMVPKEPTAKMYDAGDRQMTTKQVWDAMLAAAPQEKSVNDVTAGKPLTITLPDISSKAFWSGAGKNETFHPETYRRWAKEAIERVCIIASIDAEVR